MVRAAFDAHEFEPRRGLWKELRAGHHARARPRGGTAGQLRSNGEKEFVHAAVGYKVSEKVRATFVEQEPHPEFIVEEIQD